MWNDFWFVVIFFPSLAVSFSLSHVQFFYSLYIYLAYFFFSSYKNVLIFDEVYWKEFNAFLTYGKMLLKLSIELLKPKRIFRSPKWYQSNWSECRLFRFSLFFSFSQFVFYHHRATFSFNTTKNSSHHFMYFFM